LLLNGIGASLRVKNSEGTSVEASAAARLVERESRITVAEISEIRRQSTNPAYLRAATALASGNLHGGLARLDAMDAIVEIPDAHERRSRMVDDWFETVHATGAPAHRTQDRPHGRTDVG
jgi:hypothetical protein